MISIYKSCSKCGAIHTANYKCKYQKRKVNKKITYDMKLRNLNVWHKKSDEIRKKARYLCEVCILDKIYTYDRVEVHHINKLRDSKEQLLDNYNLICLCKVHHIEADAGKLEKDFLFQLAKQREDN